MKSWEAARWAKKVSVSQDGKPITRSEKFLLLILADYHNETLGWAWASVETLAADALYSKRQTLRLLESLAKKNFIRIDKKRGGASHYILQVAELRRPVRSSRRWDPADQWLADFLKSPACVFLPIGVLDDPPWWDSVAVACQGLSPEFVRDTFAKLRAWIAENADKRPGSETAWKDFVRRWLCRENEWQQRHASAKYGTMQ